MTCHIIKDASGNTVAIACTRGLLTEPKDELRKAMKCRYWEQCETCKQLQDCQEKLKRQIANQSPCPRCGVNHDCMNYELLFVDTSHEDYPSWYRCPSCGGKFHSMEV